MDVSVSASSPLPTWVQLVSAIAPSVVAIVVVLFNSKSTRRNLDDQMRAERTKFEDQLRADRVALESRLTEDREAEWRREKRRAGERAHRHLERWLHEFKRRGEGGEDDRLDPIGPVHFVMASYFTEHDLLFNSFLELTRAMPQDRKALLSKAAALQTAIADSVRTQQPPDKSTVF